MSDVEDEAGPDYYIGNKPREGDGASEHVEGHHFNNRNSVFFTFNFRTGKFNVDHYNEAWTEGRISKGEISRVLQPVEEALADWWSQQGKATCMDRIVLCMCCLLFCTMPCCVCYFRARTVRIKALCKKAVNFAEGYLSESNRLCEDRDLEWSTADRFPLYVQLKKHKGGANNEQGIRQQYLPDTNYRNNQVVPDMSGNELMPQPQYYQGGQTPYGTDQYSMNVYGNSNYNT